MRTKAITIGGIDLLIAPTPVIHLSAVELHFANNTANTREGREAVIEACFHGIRRARKQNEKCGGITLEWLREEVDIDSAPLLIAAFTEVNYPQAPGDPPSGEAAAQAAGS